MAACGGSAAGALGLRGLTAPGTGSGVRAKGFPVWSGVPRWPASHCLESKGRTGWEVPIHGVGWGCHREGTVGSSGGAVGLLWACSVPFRAHGVMGEGATCSSDCHSCGKGTGRCRGRKAWPRRRGFHFHDIKPPASSSCAEPPCSVQPDSAERCTHSHRHPDSSGGTETPSPPAVPVWAKDSPDLPGEDPLGHSTHLARFPHDSHLCASGPMYNSE